MVRGLLFEAGAGVCALIYICVLFYLAIFCIVCFIIVPCRYLATHGFFLAWASLGHDALDCGHMHLPVCVGQTGMSDSCMQASMDQHCRHELPSYAITRNTLAMYSSPLTMASAMAGPAEHASDDDPVQC